MAGMDRRTKREFEERAQREQEARAVSTGFYTATLHAPPHLHTVVGVVAGQERETATQAIVSMQDHAIALGADAVLGVAISSVAPYTGGPRFLAYGTAVRWAASE